MSTLFDVDTPALLVDTATLERNITAMAALAERNGKKLRPHIKTHKSPHIARLQLEAGAVGLTAAKLGEAEVMVEAGITDILIAYPLVGARKLRRLEALLGQADITVALDSVEVAAGLSELGVRLGRRLPVYVEVDTGLERLGQEGGEPSLELALEIAALDGIEVTGVMTHGGHVSSATDPAGVERLARAQAETLVETAELLRSHGLDIRHVSTGSTPAVAFEAVTPGVTELRPGTYVFNDSNTVDRWAARPEDCAAFVLATVVSRPAADRVVIDAGSKTLGADARVGGRSGAGIIPDLPDHEVVRLSEEHGVVSVPADSPLRIGNQLRVIPNHICPAVNLSDSLIAVRDGAVIDEWPVAARGKRT